MNDDPLDTDHINGIPLARFCSTCRERIRAGVQSGTKKADICPDCVATLFELGLTKSIEVDQDAPGMTSQPLTFTEVKEPSLGTFPRLDPLHEMNLSPEDVWHWAEGDAGPVLMDATGQKVPLTPGVRRLIQLAPRFYRLTEMVRDVGGVNALVERRATELFHAAENITHEPSALLTLIAQAQAAARARGTFQAPEDQRVAARAVYLEVALQRMTEAWDHFTAWPADTVCPACAVDLLDGGVHPPKTGPDMEEGPCPRAFAQQILDGVEP